MNSLQDLPDAFLQNSMAAASFDAVVSLAMAYNELLSEGKNISNNILNQTLSQLKINGLAVSFCLFFVTSLLKHVIFVEVSSLQGHTQFQIQYFSITIYR